MKTKLTALAMTLMVLVVAVGCTSILEEYEIGAAIHEIDGMAIDVRAMLWTIDEAGFIPHGSWNVSWGDGKWSSEDDAKVVQDVIYEWDYVYDEPGSYVIVLSHDGAESVFLFALIE